jgi:hypothetical protein
MSKSFYAKINGTLHASEIGIESMGKKDHPKFPAKMPNGTKKMPISSTDILVKQI